MRSFFARKWEQIQIWLHGIAIQSVHEASHSPSIIKIPPQRMLCIDDDIDFCRYIQAVARPLNIRVDCAYSMTEGKKAIEQEGTHFKAFIIDGHLPDGSGFDLVAWIKESQKINLPIAFVTRIYQDAASFRFLKEKWNVEYVLEKPLQPQDMDRLFRELLKKQRAISEEAIPDAFLAGLKEHYYKSIYDKLEKLEKLILLVQKSPAISNLQALKEEVHKLAGSSGSYGFPTVSDLCKKLEQALNQQIDKVQNGAPPDVDWLYSLDDFFSQIKFYFQIPPQEGHPTLPIPYLIAKEHVNVYLVDEDDKLLGEIDSKKGNQALLAENNPEQAYQRLSLSDFQPSEVFVNLAFSNSSLTGFDLLSRFVEEPSHHLATLGLFVDSDHANKQLEGICKGIKYVIGKPLHVESFLHLTQSIFKLSTVTHFKVLVVDDDVDMGHFIIHSLKELEVKCFALHESSQLEKTLKEETPDLILVDLNLPGYNATTILEKIRTDLGYEGWLIGLLTISHEEGLFEQADKMQLDGVLFKPLDKHILQTRVLDLAKQTKRYLIHAENDPLTGLPNRAAFEKYLQAQFLDKQKIYPLETLVLFEMDDFKTMRQAFGEEGEIKLLAEIGDHFFKCLWNCPLEFYLGEGLFGVVVDGIDHPLIELALKGFFTSIQNSFPGLKLSFSAGIGVIPQKADNLAQITDNAIRALQAAKKEKEDIKIVSLTNHHSGNQKKTVFLIEPDKEISHLLATALRQKDFTVHVAHDSKEALDKLVARDEFNPMPLLMARFALPGIQNLQILKTLQNQYHIYPPVLFLSSEQEVLNYIERGSLNQLMHDPINLLVLY